MSPSDQPPAAGDSFRLEGLRQHGDDEGLSLDELSAALQGMLDSGDDPYAADSVPQAVVSAAVHDPASSETEAASEADDACDVTPKSILEAMLFVGSPKNEPLAARQVSALMRGVRPSEIDVLVRELNTDYERRNCPYTIAAEGAGYRLKLRTRFARLRDQFYGKARQARLSQAAIEVLSIVAYREPITSDEISRLRGTPSGHILTQLVRRQLLRLERGGAKPERARYLTTPRFLALFGLASLDDLPRSDDFEEA